MWINAKSAKPGRRYTTRKGIIVEVQADPDAKARSVTTLWRDSQGQVYVFIVQPDGSLSSEYTRAKPYAKLDDGRPVVRRPRGRRGPLPRGKKSPWRGWAYENQLFMEALVKEAKARHFLLVPAHHYFRVVFLGRTVCVMFRDGQIGFSEPPKDLVRDFQVLTLDHSKYTPYVIVPKSFVSDSHKASDFIVRFGRFLQERYDEDRKSWSKVLP